MTKTSSHPVLMRTDNDCGPVAVATATGIPYDKVMSIGWLGSFHGNDDDSWMHHETALARLGLEARYLSVREISKGKFPHGKTVVCLMTKPYTAVVKLKELMNYHWYVMAGVDDQGNMLMYDGRHETPIAISPGTLLQSWGLLSYAYEVITPEIPADVTKLPWYHKLWVKTTAAIKTKLWG